MPSSINRSKQQASGPNSIKNNSRAGSDVGTQCAKRCRTQLFKKILSVVKNRNLSLNITIKYYGLAPPVLARFCWSDSSGFSVADSHRPNHNVF